MQSTLCQITTTNFVGTGLRLTANHDAGTKLRLSRMFINCARQNVWDCGNAAKGLTVRVGLCGKEKTCMKNYEKKYD